MRSSYDFPIFGGVEVTTDLGHVLAFGLTREPSASAATLFAEAQRAGALLFLAHPARDGLLKVSHETVEYFRSVEAPVASKRDKLLHAQGAAGGERLRMTVEVYQRGSFIP